MSAAPAAGGGVVLLTRFVMGFGVLVAVFGVGVVAVLPANAYMVSNAVLGVFYLALPAAGAVIVRRHARNAAGWILLAGGVCFLIKNSLDVYAATALTMHAPHVPAPTWAAWISQWGGAPQAAVVSLGVLLFPDGHLPSPRWRRIWPLAAVVIGGLLCTQGAPSLWHWDVASPVRLPYGDGLELLNVLALVLAPALYTLCAWSVRSRVHAAPPSSPQRAGLVVVGRFAWAVALAQWG